MKLIAIINTFKNQYHYIKDSKNKILVLTNYNNLCLFINRKNLSSY